MEDFEDEIEIEDSHSLFYENSNISNSLVEKYLKNEKI
jgi:hypothetical protein